MLLSNALIVDRPIQVSPYGQPVQQQTPAATTTPAPQENMGAPVEADKITQRQFNVPDDQRVFDCLD